MKHKDFTGVTSNCYLHLPLNHLYLTFYYLVTNEIYSSDMESVL